MRRLTAGGVLVIGAMSAGALAARENMAAPPKASSMAMPSGDVSIVRASDGQATIYIGDVALANATGLVFVGDYAQKNETALSGNKIDLSPHPTPNPLPPVPKPIKDPNIPPSCRPPCIVTMPNPEYSGPLKPAKPVTHVVIHPSCGPNAKP